MKEPDVTKLMCSNSALPQAPLPCAMKPSMHRSRAGGLASWIRAVMPRVQHLCMPQCSLSCVAEPKRHYLDLLVQVYVMPEPAVLLRSRLSQQPQLWPLLGRNNLSHWHVSLLRWHRPWVHICNICLLACWLVWLGQARSFDIAS